ncbi:MAG: class A beta-lactamase-related serine hydrolase, partial [Pedobacter sp.]
MIRHLVLIAFFALGLAFKSDAQTIHKARLDSMLNFLSSNNKTMGSLAITHDGKLIYQKSVGFAAIDSPATIPASAKTKYRIGSISKMLTGVLVMQLVEEGKLSLDNTLDKFYPQIQNSAKITLGMMLNHHSGLHNYTNDPLFLTYMKSPQSNEQMLTRIAAMKPDFEPGTRGQYSNTNFLLLGYILEKVTSKNYSELVKQRIINKIGLKDTYYGGKINTANNEALSYDYDGKWKKAFEFDISVANAAGGIVSTPADINKFIEALFGGKLIKPASLAVMKTITDNYGSAMFSWPFKGKTGYGHNGGIDAFVTELKYLPEEKIAVSYFSNGGAYDPAWVVASALRIYFNEPYAIPVSVETPALDKYIGVYASKQNEIKITISKEGNILFLQGSGQSKLPLDPLKTVNHFEYDAAGIVLEFRPDK